MSWQTCCYFFFTPIVTVLWIGGVLSVITSSIVAPIRPRSYILDNIVLSMILLGVPLGTAVAFLARDKLNAIITIVMMIIFWSIITIGNFAYMPQNTFKATTTSIGILLVVPPILLSVAPAKAVARRLIFLALGLLLLIGLNELSKLGIDLTAPKLQG